MNPEVSVIVAAYNTEAYIAQAIESVLGQTEENLEVIVVDDASTDSTAEIAKGFLDKRLKVLVNQQNLGASGARNRALREAKGKWVAVLDSDDWLARERLERLLQVAYAESADVVADDVYYIQDGAKFPWSTLLSQSGKRIDKISQIDTLCFVETNVQGRRGLNLGLTKPMIKREFLVQNHIEYNENIDLGEDFWLYMSCLAHQARFFLVPEPYYFYRSRKGALVTRNQGEHLEQACSATIYFLQQDFVQKNPQLVRALSQRLTLLEKTKPYFRVVDPLKRGEFLIALLEMVRNPYFFVHLITQIPRILSRWVNYYFRKIIN